MCDVTTVREDSERRQPERDIVAYSGDLDERIRSVRRSLSVLGQAN